MLVTHDVTIDVSTPKQPNVIHVVQGDSARILRITLKNKTAIYDPEADLATGETLNMAVTFDKSDGTRGGYERATWQASGAKAVVKESTGVYNCYLDQQCFAAPGFTHIFIRFFTSSGKTLHTFAVLCDVEKNPASNVTSEDFVDMPSNEEILRELQSVSNGLDDVSEELENTVKFTMQTLTDAQQAQARANIGAASTSSDIEDVVRYNALQALTAEQKRIARSNIGAPDTDKVVKVETQHLNASEKQQARDNISAVPLSDVAREYDPAGTYHTGEIRYHEGALYTCIVEISVPESWNASHWMAVLSFADILRNRVVRMDVSQPWLPGELKAKARDNIGAAAKSQAALKDSIAPKFDETLTYAVGDIVFRDDAFYICTTAIVDPGEWDISNWAEYDTIADAILGNVVRYDAPLRGTTNLSRKQQARDNIDARDVSVILVDDSNSHLPISGTAYVNSQQIVVGLLSGQMPRVGDVVIGTDSGRICSVSNISMFAPNHVFEVTASGFDLFHGIPAAPTTDGTYTLQATVSDGVVTYAWT